MGYNMDNNLRWNIRWNVEITYLVGGFNDVHRISWDIGGIYICDIYSWNVYIYMIHMEYHGDIYEYQCVDVGFVNITWNVRWNVSGIWMEYTVCIYIYTH